MGRFHRHDGEHSHSHEGFHTHIDEDGRVYGHVHIDPAHAAPGAPEAHVHDETGVGSDVPPRIKSGDAVVVSGDGVVASGDDLTSHGHHDPELLGDHSKYETGTERIEVLERIFDENDRAAARNRELFDAHGITSVNVMSSPGSGKTTLLARTLDALGQTRRVGIVEGDIETAIDAERLRGKGAQISLVNTGDGFGGECHLDAPMVAHGLAGLNLDELDLVLIENVGNLVCPAEFDVGAHRRAMVFSVTEGEDKPLKYPVMFRTVDAVVANKTDLLPYLDFDVELFEHNLREVNPTAKLIWASAKTGVGVDEWLGWLCQM